MKRSQDEIQYAYYPDGDGDPMSRLTRLDLVLESGVFRLLGQSRYMTQEEVEAMVKNLESDRAKIQRILPSGQRENAEKIIIRWAKSGFRRMD